MNLSYDSLVKSPLLIIAADSSLNRANVMSDVNSASIASGLFPVFMLVAGEGGLKGLSAIIKFKSATSVFRSISTPALLNSLPPL